MVYVSLEVSQLGLVLPQGVVADIFPRVFGFVGEQRRVSFPVPRNSEESPRPLDAFFCFIFMFIFFA